jgi:tryptophanyl-tRNA synthetase
LIEPVIEGPGARVMSLRDGLVKMSKSDASDYARINLLDDADAIVQKVRKARTDPAPLPETVEGLAGRAEADNLVGLYAALSGVSKAAVLGEFAGQGFGAFKPRLAELVAEVVAPIGNEMRRLMNDPAEIDRVFEGGAERARAVAEPVIDEVKRIVGFWRAGR